jgi:hypothetical protein
MRKGEERRGGEKRARVAWRGGAVLELVLLVLDFAVVLGCTSQFEEGSENGREGKGREGVLRFCSRRRERDGG